MIPRREYTEQNSISDYEYVMRMAGRYGKSVYCRGRTVSVRTEIAPTGDEVVLEKGKSIITAMARSSTCGQLSSASLTGWDMARCESFTATATMKDVPLKIGGEYSWEDNAKDSGAGREYAAGDPSLADGDEAMAVAEAVMQSRSMRFQSCDVKTQGNRRTVPGNRLTVKHIGEMFSGEYMIESVEHELRAGEGFVTKCHLVRNFCPVGGLRGKASDVERERAEGIAGGYDAAENSSSFGAGESESVPNENDGQNERNPEITNPHWENASGQTITRALVGDEVYLCADVSDIDDSTDAKIKIVEKDDDGNDDFVKDLKTEVQDGEIRCKWKVVYMEDNDDTESQKGMEEKGYTLPEYAFAVECDGVKSEESGQLEIKDEIKIKIQDFNRIKGKTLKLYWSDGTSKNIIIDSDEIIIKDVYIGRAFIGIA